MTKPKKTRFNPRSMPFPAAGGEYVHDAGALARVERAAPEPKAAPAAPAEEAAPAGAHVAKLKR